MTISTLGYMQFKTHRVHISKDHDTSVIYCFKATRNRCDLQTFVTVDAACDYILEPFDDIVYYVDIEGEDDQSESAL